MGHYGAFTVGGLLRPIQQHGCGVMTFATLLLVDYCRRADGSKSIGCIKVYTHAITITLKLKSMLYTHSYQLTFTTTASFTSHYYYIEIFVCVSCACSNFFFNSFTLSLFYSQLCQFCIFCISSLWPSAYYSINWSVFWPPFSHETTPKVIHILKLLLKFIYTLLVLLNFKTNIFTFLLSYYFAISPLLSLTFIYLSLLHVFHCQGLS